MVRTSPKTLLGVLLLAVLTSCNSAPDKRLLQYLNQQGFGNRYVGNAEEENYISIGDSIILQDRLHPRDLQGQGTVDIDGTVILPEVGAVIVAGNTRSELEALLTEVYSPYYDETDIKVDIRTSGKKYFIYGEVGNTGEKTFGGDLTIFEAVMSANPDDNTANLGRVRLIRADPVDPFVTTVNVGELLESGDSTFNIHVQERDIIFVPPTLLAQLGYFLDDLLFPLKQVLSGVGGALFGGGGRRRRGQGGLSGGLGNIF